MYYPRQYATAPTSVQNEEGHFELADPDIDDDTNYSVEAVLDSRINKQLRDPALNKKGLLQYQVRWADYPDGPDNPSWEPYMNLVDSADLVTEFHRRRPTKPGPHRDFGTLVSRQDLMIMAVRLVV
ncbi:Chromo domain containing protein [Pyrenophora tritici-repentis]|nr:Chromo domain containing protein [Pyrenophora tritici-repentis]